MTSLRGVLLLCGLLCCVSPVFVFGVDIVIGGDNSTTTVAPTTGAPTTLTPTTSAPTNGTGGGDKPKDNANGNATTASPTTGVPTTPAPTTAAPTASPLCGAIRLGAEAYVNATYPNLLAAQITISTQLPPALSCFDAGAVAGKLIRVMVNYYNTYGINYDAGLWGTVGWPTGVVPPVPAPTLAYYTSFTGFMATITPCTAQLCPSVCLTPVVKTLADCAASAPSSSAPPPPPSSSAPPPNNNQTKPTAPPPPPTLPPVNIPNPTDILNKFNQGLPPLGVCNTLCPNNLLCVGPTCVAPQPVCEGGCPNGFCQLNISAVLLFNTQAALGAYANQAGASAWITISAGVAVRAGNRITGFCVDLAPKCTPANCTAPGTACNPVQGCVSVPGLIPGLDLGAVLSGGFDASVITGNTTIPPPPQNNVTQTIPPGILAQIQAGVSAFGNFVIGSGAGAPPANGSAVTALVSGAQASTGQLIANIRAAAVQLAANAQLIASTIQVAANSTLEIVLTGQGAKCGANTSLAISGSLVIRGNASNIDPNNFTPQGVFNFPPNAQGNQIAAGGIINVAGGVGLTGDLGNVTLTINSIASAVAAIGVPVGQVLRSSGQVLGAAARVIVQGALNLLTGAFQPAITVASTGNVTINVGASGNFTAGPVAIQAGAKIDIWSSGANTFFSNLTQCDASAVIRIRVTSVSTLRTYGGSGYVFTYGSVNATVKASFRCGAVLYDGSGATIQLTNTNNQPASRRLLDTSANTVTFGDNSAQYSAAADSSSGLASSTGSSSPSSSSSSSASSSAGNNNGKNGNGAQSIKPAGAATATLIVAAAIHMFAA